MTPVPEIREMPRNRYIMTTQFRGFMCAVWPGRLQLVLPNDRDLPRALVRLVWGKIRDDTTGRDSLA